MTSEENRLRLFQLRQGKNGPVIVRKDFATYFSSKGMAKNIRDMIGGDTVVSYGPDHHRFTARKEK